MDTQWYTSVPGIIAGTLIIVEILKRAVGHIAVVRAVPTWVYAVVVAVGLTYGSQAAGYLSSDGSTLDTLMTAVMLAATSSGFWTWLRSPGDKLEDSAGLLDAKHARRFPAILLAVALTGSMACAPRNIAPELVAAQDAMHDALRDAMDGVNAICSDGLLVETCKPIGVTMGHALRAGRAFSAAVYSERLEGLGPFVGHVGAAISDVQKLPPSTIRDLILSDLRRAIDAAFEGVTQR